MISAATATTAVLMVTLARDHGLQYLLVATEAELALSRVDDAPARLRSARRAEWQDLVDRFIGEVAAALRSDGSRRH